MSGGSNQQYPPMGGGMGGGPQSGGPPMITGGPYQGPPQFEGGGPIGQPTFGVGMPGGGGQGYPNRPVQAVMPEGWDQPGSPNYRPPPPSWEDRLGGGNMGGLRPQQPGMGGGMPGWNDAGRMPPMNIPGQRPNWPGMGGGGRPEHTYWPQPGGGGGFQAKPTQPGGGMQGGFGDWAGLGKGFSEDQFMKARGFADRGKMGRARQAIQQGGGQWSPQLHGLLSSPSGQWGNMGWDTMA